MSQRYMYLILVTIKKQNLQDDVFFAEDPAINAERTNAAINVKEISLVPRMRLSSEESSHGSVRERIPREIEITWRGTELFDGNK